jgi:hypothetical protein
MSFTSVFYVRAHTHTLCDTQMTEASPRASFSLSPRLISDIYLCEAGFYYYYFRDYGNVMLCRVCARGLGREKPVFKEILRSFYDFFLRRSFIKIGWMRIAQTRVGGVV